MVAESLRQTEDKPCCFRAIRNGGARLIWELISICNLDCVHCFVPHTHWGMPTAEALSVIDEFPEIPVRKVMFTGGEPFLREDLLTLVEAAVSHGALVDITSNLTLIDCEKLKRLETLGSIEITTSIDGPESVHDRIRCKPGNFQKMATVIRMLLEHGIPVDVVCVAQRLNADVLGETIDTVRSLGASSITISGFNHQGPARDRWNDVSLLPNQASALAEQIDGARRRHDGTFPIRTVGLLNRFESPVPCPIHDMIAINARGQVSNCLLAPVPEKEVGDLGQGLVAAWKKLNRNYCCSQGGWADPPSTIALTVSGKELPSHSSSPRF